ncbi:hypothetical protein [Roseomonas xinghualingensis]|nr:hypothetical protein [Roseomonas sp. SXEYE001]MCV4208678.1 hypothetical protein [Roseomonas sp. SXEYE001]
MPTRLRFSRLVVAMEQMSRKEPTLQATNTMDVEFCLEAWRP